VSQARRAAARRGRRLQGQRLAALTDAPERRFISDDGQRRSGRASARKTSEPTMSHKCKDRIEMNVERARLFKRRPARALYIAPVPIVWLPQRCLLVNLRAFVSISEASEPAAGYDLRALPAHQCLQPGPSPRYPKV
jgi:hypothetical protein